MKYEGVKWVWFDLDDTLIDFHANSRLANAIIYREAGLDRYYATPEQWIEAYEGHNRLLWERYSRGEITQVFCVSTVSPHRCLPAGPEVAKILKPSAGGSTGSISTGLPSRR